MTRLVFDDKIYYQMFFQIFHDECAFTYSENLEKHGDVIFTSVWKWTNPNDFRRLIEKCERQKSKIVLLDIIGEDWEYSQKLSGILNLIHGSGSYFLSSRFWYDGRGVYESQRNYYLNLFYYYYLMSDNFLLHPQIPNGKFKDNTYDFISYLGLQNNDTDYHIDDKAWRYREIDETKFKDSTVYLPTSYKDYVPKHIRDLHRTEIFDDKDWGQWNWYSLLESQKAKIKLVFETHPFDWGTEGTYFTEKTMKCLIYNQPYILYLTDHLYGRLKEYGFRLPYSSRPKTYIEQKIVPNPSLWVERNQKLYDWNKQHFHTLLKSKDLPHYKFIKEIIGKKYQPKKANFL